MTEIQTSIETLDISGKNAKLIKFVGQLDETNVDEEAKKIYQLLEEEKDLSLVIDLTGLTYMNSKSIGYLTDWYTKINETGGKMVITGAQENILDVLSVVGLTNIIEHFSSLEEAKNALAE
ncbi:MAG TPA: STAS domain-containing protein [Candidatus Peregrinibacteria bacterium]|nr:STAS domain-containing protein [Candidatus Peregrinibacteria bacterium]